MSVDNVSNNNPIQNPEVPLEEIKKEPPRSFSTWGEMKEAMTKEELDQFLMSTARPYIMALDRIHKEAKSRRKAEESG